MIVPIKFQNDDALNYVLVDTGSGALAVHIDNQIDTVTNYNEHACNSTQQCGSINCCNGPGSICMSGETCQEKYSSYITAGATKLKNKLGLAADASLTPTLQCYGSGGWYGLKTNSSFVFF
jgi:hypothetical protein